MHCPRARLGEGEKGFYRGGWAPLGSCKTTIPAPLPPKFRERPSLGIFGNRNFGAKVKVLQVFTRDA